MINREALYTQVFEQKRQSLARKKAQIAQKRQIALDSEPRIGEIDRLLARHGATLAETALAGDSDRLADLQQKMTALLQEKQALMSRFVIPEMTYDCAACKDTGYVSGKICTCVHAAVRRLALEEFSVEMPLRDCRFDNFSLDYYVDSADENGVNPRRRMTGILEFCRGYVRQFSPQTAENLLFLGNTGLGKTHLTLAIVAEVLRQDFDVVYGPAYNLLSQVEKEHFSAEKGNSYEQMLQCDLLVIDDLGTEFCSPFTLSVLYNLINSRLLARRPTVINTNLSLPEMERRYDPRIVSRLLGNYTARRFVGQDIRQIKAMRAKK